MGDNKTLTKTTKSALDIQMDGANKEAKNKKGISFYCGSQHAFMFIPNVKAQDTNYSCLKTIKNGKNNIKDRQIPNRAKNALELAKT